MRAERPSTATAEAPSAPPEPSIPTPRAQVRKRARDLSWTLFGKIAMTGANALVLLAPAEYDLLDIRLYGLFATCIGLQLLVSRMVLFGADQGMIRLFTVRDVPDPEAIVGAGLQSTLVLSLAAFALGGLMAVAGPWLVPALRPWPLSALLAVPIGAVGSALFDYGVCTRLTHLRYRRAALVQASMPIVRMVLTLGFLVLVPEAPAESFLVYAGTTLVFGLYLSARTRLAVGRLPGFALVKRLLVYSKWPAAADVLTMFCLNQGLFLLSYLGQDQARGVYAFCVQLGFGWFAVFLAFYQTILPRAARVPGIEELPAFIARWTKVALLLGAGCAVLAPLLVFGLHHVLSNPHYAGFPVPFLAQTAFMVIMLLETPLTVACQYLLLPQLPVFNLGLRVVAIGGLGFYLAPAGGAYGAATAQWVGAAASFVVFALVMLFVIRGRLKAACAESQER